MYSKRIIGLGLRKRNTSNLIKYRSNSSGLVDIVGESGIPGSPRITAYGDDFIEINDVVIEEPVIAFRESYAAWKIKSKKEITAESLTLVWTHFPTVDLLLLGLGKRCNRRLPQKLIDDMKTKGIIIEQGTTFHAASTFNILVGEGRNVAIAIVPDDFDEHNDLT